MAGRIRLLSIERGHDPRDFAILAFGGAGPVHGAAMIREVGIGALLVPQFPGVRCAMGCAAANVRYDYSRTMERRLDEIPRAELAGIMREQRAQGEAQLRASEAPVDSVAVSHAADMAYLGQIHAMRVPVEADWDAARMTRAFNDVYRAEFGNTLDDIPAMVVNVRTTVEGLRRRAKAQPANGAERGAPAPSGRRKVHFGAWIDTPLYRRTDLLPGMRLSGPAIVEQTDTTTVVEPDMRIKVDGFGNLVVEAA